jgi:hypothetical protein
MHLGRLAVNRTLDSGRKLRDLTLLATMIRLMVPL